MGKEDLIMNPRTANPRLVINPRQAEVTKDLHVYVRPELYDMIQAMIDDKTILTKTKYVTELIERDLTEREIVW